MSMCVELIKLIQVLVQLLLLLNQTASYEDFNIAAYNASWAPISYVYPESSKLTSELVVSHLLCTN